MDYLSSDSINLLTAFYNGLTIHDESLFDESCIDQLVDNGLIESRFISYDFSSDDAVSSNFSDYVITEKGKGYMLYLEDNRIFQESVKQIADSAKTQSDLAIKKAKKADIKGWIAVGISAFSLMLEIICNYEQIAEFLSLLF